MPRLYGDERYMVHGNYRPANIPLKKICGIRELKIDGVKSVRTSMCEPQYRIIQLFPGQDTTHFPRFLKLTKNIYTFNNRLCKKQQLKTIPSTYFSVDFIFQNIPVNTAVTCFYNLCESHVKP
jgi:hypothetical protein